MNDNKSDKDVSLEDMYKKNDVHTILHKSRLF